MAPRVPCAQPERDSKKVALHYAINNIGDSFYLNLGKATAGSWLQLILSWRRCHSQKMSKIPRGFPRKETIHEDVNPERAPIAHTCVVHYLSRESRRMSAGNGDFPEFYSMNARVYKTGGQPARGIQ